MILDPISLIVVVVLSILLVWLVTRGGIGEPARTIFIAVLAIAILLVVLRILGIY
jgi:hypothetical protein